MDFKLPDIGEGVAEGEVVRWLVKTGDAIREDQPMVEVMTDKATVEITSPVAGTVGEIRAKEGTTVPVGSVLVVLNAGTAAAPKASPAMAATGRVPAPATPRAATPPLAVAPVAGAAPVVAPAPAHTPAVLTPRDDNGQSARVLATPATRKLARELGVDLTTVAGTGPRGRVTREDVQNSAGRAPTTPAPIEAATPAAPVAPRAAAKPLPVQEREERVPLRGLRKRIAAQMVKSKTTAPHFTYVEEVDVTEVVKLRQESKEIAAQRGVKLTYLPFIIKALIPALRQFPLVNASLDDAREELVLKRYYNLGIAVATNDGLIVPVIKDADRKSILEIAGEIEQKSARCRAGKATLDDLTGGTFTITSAGNIGGLFATPIINHPEVAILGVHKIVRRPVYVGDQIVPRDIMYLSLSLDHRVVDGAVGAEFMNVVVKYLQQPKLLLLESV